MREIVVELSADLSAQTDRGGRTASPDANGTPAFANSRARLENSVRSGTADWHALKKPIHALSLISLTNSLASSGFDAPFSRSNNRIAPSFVAAP